MLAGRSLQAEEENSTKRARQDTRVTEIDRKRLQKLLDEGRLLHPLKSDRSNFADLAQALAICCGLPPARRVRQAHADKLAKEIGGVARKHVVFVLCDGMGSSIFDLHLDTSSFLHKQNDPDRLLAVFPATTPAALATLATAAWPGQHGAPGWELRDQLGCEFPGEVQHGPVQLTVLDSVVRDMRSKRPASEVGFEDRADIYIEPAWASLGNSIRKMRFINAYNGSEFTDWYQGNYAGQTANIQETAYETLGQPEGSSLAIEYFNNGIDKVLESVNEAEKEGSKTYTYLYTAHPDKHMHTLGIEHPEVCKVMNGINAGLERLWKELERMDAALVVTADHGHITVNPPEMVTIPDELLQCLEYANIGVLGKGRHACLHCRSGRQAEFEKLWAACAELRDNFVLLTVDAAAEEGLFGPDPPVPKVRPRLGDLIAVSIGAHTLTTPNEAARNRDCDQPCCRGAHGSLTPAEMRIPFVLCTSSDVPPPPTAIGQRPKRR